MNKKVRGFEIAKGWEEVVGNWIDMPEGAQENKGFCPMRATKNAAGYDIKCAKEVRIEPLFSKIVDATAFFAKAIMDGVPASEAFDIAKKKIKPTLVATGVKAYMQDDEALFLHNRSSNPLKKMLVLSNGVGVIDSDYYSNPDNDGHIMLQFWNFGFKTITIPVGERIGQGIFQKYLKADMDIEGKERTGGHGSTGTK